MRMGFNVDTFMEKIDEMFAQRWRGDFTRECLWIANVDFAG